MFQNSKTRYFTRLPSLWGKSRGASDSEYLFVFHVSWELRHFLIQHVGYVVTFGVSMPGSFHSKMTCLLELSTGKLQKCKKRSVFDAKSLQTVELPTGSSKYVKNRVLFRKHHILRNKIKPQCFAPFPWSSNLNLCIFLRLNIVLHKSMGALNWELSRGKKRGAPNSKCTASLEGKRIHWELWP